MSSHKKAKRIVTQTGTNSQEKAEMISALDALAKAALSGDLEAEKKVFELDETIRKMGAAIRAHSQGKPSSPKHPTARMVHQTLDRIMSDIDILQNADAYKSQIPAATKALFTIIESAEYSIQRLTGRPGIIFQSSLQEALEERGDFTGGAPRPGFTYLSLKLETLFKDGWLVEPGRFFLKRNQAGTLVLGDRDPVDLRPAVPNPQMPSPETKCEPRPTRPDTPTPGQLQAWFDLPSELPRAEGS